MSIRAYARESTRERGIGQRRVVGIACRYGSEPYITKQKNQSSDPRRVKITEGSHIATRRTMNSNQDPLSDRANDDQQRSIRDLI